MKRSIILLLITISAYSCENNSAIVNKTANVQACLDELLLKQKKYYNYLEHCKLILVKDSHTADLGQLHYGGNKIAIKDTPPSDIKVYAPEKDDTGIRYLKLKYIIVDNNTINVEIDLPNVNSFIKFRLTRTGNIWKAKLMQILIA
ncbi:MAG: hypothetical protein H7289_03880 [Mucilaginibacter sp.]|nr:hypothetical protein [Mucilaginibacter sp.]